VTSNRKRSGSVDADEATRLEDEARLRALAAFIADYEADHGPITAADTEAAVREAKRRAISVRPLP